MNDDFRAYKVCTNFRRGVLQRGRRTEVEPLNLVIIHIMHHHLSDILRYLVICIIIKALNHLLMIQRQMTLKVYNV